MGPRFPLFALLLLFALLAIAWLQLAEGASYPISGAPCNYAEGRWIRSKKTRPLYSAKSCKTIRSQANCYKNGRHDYNYLNWRWQPDQCNLERFDSAKFLSKYRNKIIGIAGDSFSANFEDSLQCTLSSNSSTSKLTSSLDTYDVSGFVINAYNVTVLHISAAFLVDAAPIGKASSSGAWKINLDKPSSTWGNILNKIDVFIFNAGHWFINAPDSLRQYYIGGKKQSGLSGFEAMRIALTTVRNTIVKSNYRGIPVLLTFSPFHYGDSFSTDHDCSGWWRPLTQAEFQVAITKSEAAAAVKLQLAVFTGSASASGGSGAAKKATPSSAGAGRSVMEEGVEVTNRVEEEEEREEAEGEEVGSESERGRVLKASSSSKDRGGKAMEGKPAVLAKSFGSTNTRFGNVKFNILDITLLSLIRPDAHIQQYSGQGGKVDCSHWCTPGLPDTWSDILYNMLMH